MAAERVRKGWGTQNKVRSWALVLGGGHRRPHSIKFKWWCICPANGQPASHEYPASCPQFTSVVPHAPHSHLKLLLIHPENVLRAARAGACWAGDTPARPQVVLLSVCWTADGRRVPAAATEVMQCSRSPAQRMKPTMAQGLGLKRSCTSAAHQKGQWQTSFAGPTLAQDVQWGA